MIGISPALSRIVLPRVQSGDKMVASARILGRGEKWGKRERERE